jgi:predicted phosphodiesterase
LSSAPSVVGNARSIVSDFDVYQQELARLVTNMTKLYDAASTLPAYNPDPTTLRVLHVSDIHLNPAAWQIIESIVTEYKIDVIIDTGDLMDHGTTAENGFTSAIPDLGAPYVFVRGNHDSLSSQQSVASRKGAHVVDNGESIQVKGLRIAGIGDPQFTPDRSVAAEGDPAERAAGQELAAAIRRQNTTGDQVDIAIAHNPVAAAEADGTAPLILSGHLHHRDISVLKQGSRMMIEGSTGGGGLRAVENSTPQKIMASVLYLDRDTKKLQAWDEITLGGLGLTTAEVSRHLPEDVKPGRSPTPATSP